MFVRQYWRRSIVPKQGVFAELFNDVGFPLNFSLAIDAGERTAFEIHKDAFAITDGRRIAAGSVPMLASDFDTKLSMPKSLATCVKTQQRVTAIDGRCDKNQPIANDWRGASFARQRCLPSQIVVVQRTRILACFDTATIVWPTPRWPICIAGGRGNAQWYRHKTREGHFGKSIHFHSFWVGNRRIAKLMFSLKADDQSSVGKEKPVIKP